MKGGGARAKRKRNLNAKRRDRFHEKIHGDWFGKKRARETQRDPREEDRDGDQR